MLIKYGLCYNSGVDIKKLIKPNIRALRAYQAEEIPCRIKLDANESPYSAISSQSGSTRTEQSAVSFKNNLQTLNRYPDPQATTIRKLIAKELKVKPQNILHGNGSDELIYNLISVFGGPVLYPGPTFSMYGIISQALGEKKVEVPLDNKFDLDVKKMLAAIKKYKPKLVFLSSPNNPTGNCFSEDRILKIIRQSKGLVIVDEAYQPFSDKKSFVPLIRKYKNLVILRTLSKIGLAGLRVGFMITGPDIINEVNKVRLPFNVNVLSQKVASEALQNRRQMKSDIRAIISGRKRLYKELSEMDGVIPYPSDANFIFFKVEDGNRIYGGLLDKGVLIRNMNSVGDGFLRVTIGTPQENEIFIKTLKQVL
ncbi:MAG: histidinol-phosphate transaminase [Nitrospiraceae bacterium]|nr:MAG: histidinol-phosphate transaminase [Nitrospiraceae bacterium]